MKTYEKLFREKQLKSILLLKEIIFINIYLYLLDSTKFRASTLPRWTFDRHLFNSIHYTSLNIISIGHLHV